MTNYKIIELLDVKQKDMRELAYWVWNRKRYFGKKTLTRMEFDHFVYMKGLKAVIKEQDREGPLWKNGERK